MNKSDKINYLRIFCDSHSCNCCPIRDYICYCGDWGSFHESGLDYAIDILNEYENEPQSPSKETSKKDIEDNQNNKYDSGKPKISLVPTAIIWDIAQVREYGNRKYNSPDGWKTVEPQRYIDALLRHTLAFMRDPHSIDAESGIEHYKHMACNLAFLCELWREK